MCPVPGTLTLAFVMAGAVAVTGPAFRFVRRMPAPALGGEFPAARQRCH